jgi:hypothetical protein
LNAANVARAVLELRNASRAHREKAQALVANLRDRCQRYADGPSGARQRTAESAHALLATMAAAADEGLIAAVANATLETSEAAVGRCLAQATACTEALNQTRWEVLDALPTLSDHRAGAAQAIQQRLIELLVTDEHVLPMRARLAELERDALRLLTVSPPPPPPPPPPLPPPPPPPPPPVDPALQLVEERELVHLKRGEAGQVLDGLKRQLDEDQELELILSWRLQRRTRGH